MFDQIVVPDRTRPDTFPQEAELAWLGFNNFITIVAFKIFIQTVCIKNFF